LENKYYYLNRGEVIKVRFIRKSQKGKPQIIIQYENNVVDIISIYECFDTEAEAKCGVKNKTHVCARERRAQERAVMARVLGKTAHGRSLLLMNQAITGKSILDE